MNQAVYEALSKAQTLFEQDQEAQALEVLETLRVRRERLLTDYENAHILNMMASIEQDRGDSAAALQLFRQALAYEDIPETLRINLSRNVAQIHLLNENYGEALQLIRQVIAGSETVDPSNYVLQAQVLYYLERYDEARKSIEKALELDSRGGSPPRENWLLLANAIYYGQGDYQSMLDLNHRLMALYPRDRYMMNLAAIYGELEQTEKQLALVEAVFEGGFIEDSSNLMNLASLYMLHETPYKGAVLLEKAIEGKRLEEDRTTIERLARAWLMAAEYERAIPYLTRVAEMVETGDPYVRLASTHMALGEWEATAQALQQALRKGDLKDPGTAHLLRGTALFRLKQFERADQAFQRAASFENTARLAEQWRDYLQSEIAKLEALRAS